MAVALDRHGLPDSQTALSWMPQKHYRPVDIAVLPALTVQSDRKMTKPQTCVFCAMLASMDSCLENLAGSVPQTQHRSQGHYQSEIVCVTRICTSMERLAGLVQMGLRHKVLGLLPLLIAYVQRVLS